MVCANFAHTTSLWRSSFNGFSRKERKARKEMEETSDRVQRVIYAKSMRWGALGKPRDTKTA